MGSSAKTICGREASARAAATRCCCPPDSSVGRWVSRSVEARGCRRSTATQMLVRLAAGDADRQHDVLRRGHRRQQVERLEDEADLVAAQQRERLVVERGDLGVAEEHLARRRPVEAGEHVQQGRLAGARRAHDRGELAGLEADVDVVERGDGRVAGAVELADALGPGRGRRDGGGAGGAGGGGHVVSPCARGAGRPRSSGVHPAKAFRPADPIGLGARRAGAARGRSAADRAADPTPGVRALPSRAAGGRRLQSMTWWRCDGGPRREQLAGLLVLAGLVVFVVLVYVVIVLGGGALIGHTVVAARWTVGAGDRGGGAVASAGCSHGSRSSCRGRCTAGSAVAVRGASRFSRDGDRRLRAEELPARMAGCWPRAPAPSGRRSG